MKKRAALFNSVIALILCVAMLAGSTFAWFTDSVTNTGNIIKSGKLDLEMYWAEDLSGDWNDVENAGTNKIFDYEYWEPGYTQVRYIKIVNAGNLAFRYVLDITPNGEVTNLADVIDVYSVVAPAAEINSRTDLTNPVGTLRQAISGEITAKGVLYPENAAVESGEYAGEIILGIALKMREDAGNEYQNKSIGDSFGVTLLATQYTHEEDSFGDDYDTDAELPGLKGDATGSTDVETENGATTVDATITTNTDVKATVPAGVKVEGSKLSLSVTAKEGSDSNITAGEGENLAALDVHIDGVSADNTTPIIVELGVILGKGLNQGNLSLYHVEDGATNAMTQVLSLSELDEHNEYYYDPATGNVTVALATFSEVAVVADEDKAWEGNFDYTWYDADATDLVIANADQLAAFGAIVGGMAKDENGNFLITYTDSDGDEHHNDSFKDKTVKLISDVNLGDKDDASTNLFYPIGYYNEAKSYTKQGTATAANVSSFCGTFDGNGHTIANFYQNTWQMWGNYDGNNYKAAMGLFGYVVNGKVCNLTVDNFSSDGEFTPTGVIAAYAVNSTFENIAITNCNPRVYNTGNGGIVGIGGNTSDTEDLKLTFTNITIDNSNIITALWGSWDVACGGLVGMFRGAGHVYMTNCHVAAQIDVYNDVCGNYQYYWYRYSGMMVGTNKNMITDANGYTVPETEKYHATDCTVHFGEWNDYYYCELVANSLASYTHDHQFSRLTEISSLDEIKSGDTWTKTGNFLLISGDTKTCYHIVKDTDGTLKRHLHTDAGEETVNGETVLKEDKQIVYLPFNQLFTGYGWGVKHIPVYNGEDYAFEGITILDREEGNSVEKFEGKVAELANNKEYKIGDIFTFVDNGVELVPGALIVTVTNLDENNPVSATIKYDRTDWANGTLTLTGTGTVKITIQDYYFCTPTTITVDVKNAADITLVDRFAVAFPSTEYVNRVGNVGTVALGKLFTAKDGIGANVTVTFETVVGATVDKTEIKATKDAWATQTVQFSGTGIVKVTISDDNFSTPVTQYLEVVDATNVTTKTDATDKNIVLLNDVSGGFTVSNGYAVYGNGFKAICSGDGSYKSASLSYAYITISKGGILDNVQVICDIFPESYLFTSEMTANSSGKYPYGYSAVIVSGNSTISNCYIYGARNNILVTGGDVTISDTVTECGSFANIHINASDSDTVTLHNVTTIQYRTTSDYDTTKEVLGIGIAVGTHESTSNATIVLTGDLKQYNWVTSDDTSVSNTYAKTAIESALKETDYQHKIGDKTAINMGIAYLNTKTANYTDNRTNKDTVEYKLGSITMTMQGFSRDGQAYSVYNGGNTSKTLTDRYDAEADGVIPYMPTSNRPIDPKVTENTGNDAIAIEYVFDGVKQEWVNKMTVDLDSISGGSYNFSFDSLKVQKYGQDLEFTVKDAEGNSVDKSASITLNALVTYEYVLAATYDGVEYSVNFALAANKSSIPDPTITYTASTFANTTINHSKLRLADTKSGDWRPTVNALIGVAITYWSTSQNKEITLDLADLDLSDSSKYSISSNVFTYTGDEFTLTLTGGEIKTGYNITPIVSSAVDSTARLYFCSTNVAYGTTSANDNRTIKIDYVLTANGATDTESRSETVNFSGLTVYNYSKFKSNTLEEAGYVCVTSDTLVTLADGTQKRIDQVTYEDQLLVWDFFTGDYDVVPAAIIFYHGDDVYRVLALNFEDGTTVKVINNHGFFDTEMNSFVIIDEENVSEYIGRSFAKVAGDGVTTVKLVGYEVSEEYTGSYSIQTAMHNNFMTEGMFSITMPHYEGWFDYFEIGEGMKYDEAKMQADIEKYGLYTYEDFAEYVTYEQFIAFNGPYLKVLVGRGVVTYEQILYLINSYVNP